MKQQTPLVSGRMYTFMQAAEVCQINDRVLLWLLVTEQIPVQQVGKRFLVGDDGIAHLKRLIAKRDPLGKCRVATPKRSRLEATAQTGT